MCRPGVWGVGPWACRATVRRRRQASRRSPTGRRSCRRYGQGGPQGTEVLFTGDRLLGCMASKGLARVESPPRAAFFDVLDGRQNYPFPMPTCAEEFRKCPPAFRCISGRMGHHLFTLTTALTVGAARGGGDAGPLRQAHAARGAEGRRGHPEEVVLPVLGSPLLAGLHGGAA